MAITAIRSEPLRRLLESGQRVWVDTLSRRMLDSGELSRLIADDGVSGVTSNPSIFKTALAGDDAYDAALLRLDPAVDAKTAFRQLACQDVRRACDLLRPVFDAGGDERDGFVSLEVDPHLSDDTAATVREAEELHRCVDRPNLLVKIPATEAGVRAIEDTIAAGRSVNVTLIFALGRYNSVAETYVRGVERLIAAGGDASTVHSVASFFVSRVDTETDRRLHAIGTIGADHLAGRLGIANAKLAYQRYREMFSGERWERLAAAGARPQRCLWASTSTKNPAYRDVRYVEELIGPETINTMTLQTLRAFAGHGWVHRTLDRAVDDAARVFVAIAEAGVDYGDVTRTLEREGIAAFRAAYDDLLRGIDERRRLLGYGAPFARP